MKENEHAKRILNADPGRKQGCGRTMLRWIDGVIENLRTVGCRNCKTMALDNNELLRLLG